MKVRVCSGKPTTIVASRKGFYPTGKHLLLSHSLVGLLQQISRAFDAVSLKRLPFFAVYSQVYLLFLFILSFSLVFLCLYVFIIHFLLKAIVVIKLIFCLQAYKGLMKAFTEHNKVCISRYVLSHIDNNQ